MIKLIDLLEEINSQQHIGEGWKENIMAAAIASAGLFGKASAQDKQPTKDKITPVTQTSANSIKISLSSIFESGRYIIRGNSLKDLENKLQELGIFIQKHPEMDYKIQIVASESQVPNRDAEKPGNPPMKKGELAGKRSEIITQAVQKYINDIQSFAKIPGKIQIVSPEILIGNVEFNPKTDHKDDQKFKKDQFVEIKIEAVAKKTENFSEFSRDGQVIYDENKHAIGIIFWPERETSDKSAQGQKERSKENVLFRKLVDETDRPFALSKKIDQKNVYSGDDYVIPWQEFNSKLSGNQMDSEELKTLMNPKYKTNG